MQRLAIAALCSALSPSWGATASVQALHYGVGSRHLLDAASTSAMAALFDESAGMSGDTNYVGLGTIAAAPSTTNATYNGTMMCYGVPCDTTLAMAACMPTASLDMPTYVNYKQVLGTLTYSRPYMMGDCSNGTCDMAVTGPGSLDTDNFAKLNATSYTVAVTASNETEPVDVWYLPQSCIGATSQVLVHSITYDITPPFLTIIKLTGDTNTTIITTEPSDYSAVTARRHLLSTAWASIKAATGARRSLLATTSETLIFEFSESVVGFNESSIDVTNGEITSFSGNDDNSTFIVVVEPTNGASAITVAVSEDAYRDLAGNTGSANIDSVVSTSTGSATTESSSSSASSGAASLGNGAIIGIAIGGFFFLLLLILLFLVMATALRRKHRKETEAEQAAAAGKGAPGAGTGVAVTASAAGDPVAAPATDIEGGKGLRKLTPQKTEPPAGQGLHSEFSKANMRSSKSELPVSRPAASASATNPKKATRFGGVLPSFLSSGGSADFGTPAASFTAGSSGHGHEVPAAVASEDEPDKYGSGSYDGPILRYSSNLEEIAPVKASKAAEASPSKVNAPPPSHAKPNPLFITSSGVTSSKLSDADMSKFASPNALYSGKTAGSHAWDSVDLSESQAAAAEPAPTEDFYSPVISRRQSNA